MGMREWVGDSIKKLIKDFKIKNLDKLKSDLFGETIDETAKIYFIADIDCENHHHVYISDSCEKLLGYPKEKFLNDYTAFYSILHEDDKKIIENEILDADYRKTTSNFKIKHADGHYLNCVSSNLTAFIECHKYAYGYTSVNE